MSKFIPVEPEKWAEILTSEARLKGRIIALEAELESEKATHKALRSLSFTTAVPSEEYEKLKAEVERLRNFSNAFLDVCDKYAMFRNDDERMIASVSSYALRAAAKEGKPSA